MFLRKLCVLVLPLLLLLGVCLLLPLISVGGFAETLLKGVLIGIVLSLLLPLSGAVRHREPFGGLLWLPALITGGLLLIQYLIQSGKNLPAADLLRTEDPEIVLTEAVFFGFMLTTCLRTRK